MDNASARWDRTNEKTRMGLLTRLRVHAIQLYAKPVTNLITDHDTCHNSKR